MQSSSNFITWEGRNITEQLERSRFHITGISSVIRTKLRDWAVWQAGGWLLLSGSSVLK